MAQPSGHASFLYRLARSLFEAPGWREAVAVAAEEIGALAPRSAVLIFLVDPDGVEIRCVHSPRGAAIEGQAVPLRRDGDLLVQALAGTGPRVFDGRRLTRESVQHLKWDGREPPGSLTIIPLPHRGRSVGALELVGAPPDPGDLADDATLLTEIGSLLGTSLATLRSQEGRGLGQLEALTRLTHLYDIGRTFNATLEIEDLLPLVANRIANVLQAEQCNVYLVEEDGSLTCAAAWGPAAAALTEVLGKGEGIAGQAAVLGREVVAEDGGAAAAVLRAKETVLGVLEVRRPLGGDRFGHADLLFLRDLASQAAIALHNARLLEAERKVGQLHALLEVGREATSTLDLGRVLAAVVNRGSTLLPYDRAAIGLRERGRIRIAAVSGMLEVDLRSDDVVTLSEAVRWAAGREGGVYLSELEGEIQTDLPGARELFGEYFQKTGMKSLVSFPLSDEEGNLGVLTLESPTPYFLSEAQLELAQILALQATVAIRNARLYQEVPLRSVMEPWMRRKSAWLRLPLWKRVSSAAAALALAAVVALVPLRLRVAGTATVVPLRRLAVSAEVDGTVERVAHREGDRVAEGEVIAVLHDMETRMALAQARANLDIARRERSRLDADLEFARAQMEGVKLAQLDEEVALLEKKAARIRLKAPAAGVILTPRIEEKVGTMMRRGEVFCELAEVSGPAVEILLPEEEIGGIRPGAPVWLKVQTFPARTFHGNVYRVGARALETPQGRFFTVRARVEDGAVLRPGMTGRAKAAAGRHRIGYILFRRPARWIWGKVWPWLP